MRSERLFRVAIGACAVLLIALVVAIGLELGASRRCRSGPSACASG
jgi:hypothetical protein